ncbi:PREDICTED: double-strand break repair protein MRE11-like [Camelina sativa]|uniref:Double-strand break repair protein MRE11-like n=1 Tax=Camelina sativa TaxID=90675 RepID=A0ABM0ULT3_CAMSA|nr:PREDICTED: double-strand break repair protein MRE11-like [Camelina sativa]
MFLGTSFVFLILDSQSKLHRVTVSGHRSSVSSLQSDQDSDAQKIEEDDLILKVGECLEERLKDRSTRPTGSSQFLPTGLTSENLTKRSSGIANASCSDDEDTTQMSGLAPATRGRRGSSTANTSRGRAKAPTRGRGRGKAPSAMKQTTLDGSLGFRQSQRRTMRTLKAKDVKDQLLLREAGVEVLGLQNVVEKTKALLHFIGYSAKTMTRTKMMKT